MPEWEKETLKLKKNHGWKGKDGYRIFVADRGAIRFNFPQDWIVAPGDDSINFHDKQPPDDDCRLAVSCMRLPAIDWTARSLASKRTYNMKRPADALIKATLDRKCSIVRRE